jgi:hypothetical protein
MKLRSLLLFGAGVLTGLTIAKKMSEDDPQIQHGPTHQRSSQNPAMRVVSDQAQRIADRATVASLDAIRRARGAIRERLGEDDLGDAAWN